MTDKAKPVNLCRLPLLYHRHGGNYFSGYPQTPTALVQSYVVCDESKEWCERFGIAAGTGLRQLFDRLELVA